MQRNKLLAIVTAAAVGFTALGWVAGQAIKSPADIAAETKPPQASLITVPVESRVLSSNIIVRGTIGFDEQTDLSVPASDGAAVVTRVPKLVGEQLLEGDVMIEVSGRPVIVLGGSLPAFRSFTPGLEGPDVQQLEEALSRLGYSPGPIDTVYSAETQAAVSALYRDRGYRPVEPSLDELAQIESARARVRSAREGLRSAESMLANSGVSQSTRLQLDQAVQRAEAELVIATETARVAKEQAQRAVDDAQHTFDADPSPDNEQALTAARNEQIIVNATQDQAYADAQTNLEVARAQRTEGLSTDTSAAVRMRDEARIEVAAAEEDLRRVEASIGVTFPAGEVLFLSTLPREIQTLHAEVGTAPSGPIMTVSGSGTLIESALSGTDRSLVDVGAVALLEDDGLGISIEAQITYIADQPTSGPNATDRYVMRLEPLEELPEEAYHLSLRITIPIESTGGEVLAVPLAALSAGPDGSARVEIERTPGQTEMVNVVTGLRAQGYVEITPVEGQSVKKGDRAVVGRDLELPATVTANAEGDEGRDEADTSEGSEE